jgi:hypothetical protein
VSGFGGTVLLDNSAWARLARHGLPAAALQRFERAVRARRVRVCAPTMLEALFSARDAVERARIALELESLGVLVCDDRTWELALDAQAALTEAPGVSHRVALVDLVIAAAAHQHGVGVLHYDHDFDVIAEHGGLRFASVWVAERGVVA